MYRAAAGQGKAFFAGLPHYRLEPVDAVDRVVTAGGGRHGQRGRGCHWRRDRVGKQFRRAAVDAGLVVRSVGVAHALLLVSASRRRHMQPPGKSPPAAARNANTSW
ncbi:hypothetical protein LP419_05675 [Massilia sp. H-1]|nr:hypothetical protein LP419_05675 [Massilia sp. H-1]